MSSSQTSIDLTLDDEDDDQRCTHAAKKCRLQDGLQSQSSQPQSAYQSPAAYTGRPLGPPPLQQLQAHQQHHIQHMLYLQQRQHQQQQQQQQHYYNPQHQYLLQQQQQQQRQQQQQQQQPAQQVQQQSYAQSQQKPVASSSRQVIDLTGRTPSPPPRLSFAELPPNTPVCIGQLTTNALVLYPVDYLKFDHRFTPPHPLVDEWAPVRVHCVEGNRSHKPNAQDTIEISSPEMRFPDGTVCGGEAFAHVEQRAASTLCPMLSKALLRVNGRIRRLVNMPPILPLELLVFTPKGNIDVVAGFLQRSHLMLDHPSADNSSILKDTLYHNPHNPPPGGFRNMVARNTFNRFTQPAAAKSCEVQRTQVVEGLFKKLDDVNDDLPETEPASDVATKMYPHQKKALTFLLEREREITRPDGSHSSLFTSRHDALGRLAWHNIVTKGDMLEPPKESRSALLADDMGLGKTISCVALVGSTIQKAHEFGNQPVPPPVPPQTYPVPGSGLHAAHFAGSVWGMPDPSATGFPMSLLGNKPNKTLEKRAEEDYARACRLKTRSRATLIVCPLSTVSNWEEQFREHWRGEVTVVGGAAGNAPSSAGPSGSQTPAVGELSTASLQAAIQEVGMSGKPNELPSTSSSAPKRDGTPIRLYVYHGNARRPDPYFLADFDIVLTTYSTLASEYSKQLRSIAPQEEDEAGGSDGAGGSLDLDESATQKKKAKKRKPRLPPGQEATSPLQMIHWFRVVLDEAHSIKEINTVACRASCDLMADRRICLTGTPVQNKVDDLYALIKFMRIYPFDDKSTWTENIGGPIKFGQQEGINRLQTIMSCITLRRTKESKNSQGQPILTLPPRRDEVRYLKFDENEQAIYNEYFDESKAEFAALSRTGQVMKNYVGILQKLLRLRQICDHWQLVEVTPVSADGKDFIDTASGVDSMVDSMSTNLSICSATVAFGLLRESGTAQCCECGGEMAAPLDAWDRDAPEPDPQCIAPSGNKRGRKPKSSAPGTRANSPSATGQPPAPRPIMTKCRHLFCVGCFRNASYLEWPEPPPPPSEGYMPASYPCPTCQCPLALPGDAIEVSPDAAVAAPGVKKKPFKKEKRQKPNVAPEDFQTSTKIRALMGDLTHFSRANPYSTNYDASSVDVEVVDSQGVRTDDNVVKTVVFSQWTSMLDKIEDALEIANIQFERLDGTMKRDDRTKAIDALKHNPACEVLLVSLRAGGVGLNLTAATRCYLMDPYWNPAVENQAIDRIHRLGQTRPVETIKLIIENTIEARLLEMQKKKTDMANMALMHTGERTKAAMAQQRLAQLTRLFDIDREDDGST